MLPVQTWLEQSLDAEHVLLSAQALLHDPPQSMSVSLPFLTMSLHLGAWQMRPVQTPLEQSLDAEHALPSLQALHAPPPQSMSVSLPFLTVSLHLGAWQTKPVQTRVEQSLFWEHAVPSAQALHVGPPQSTPVSLPFRIPSRQVGPTRTHIPAAHAPPAHNVLSATFSDTQPVPGLQLSVVQELPSLHTTALPAQTPLAYTSPVVQLLASSQLAPSG
jgi:hypothetical protein